ncbi:MAG: 50S ribosomal protein L13 [Desulfobacteraceae bacterium]|nr:50S ribosomal protein L13 [Desulfobacteraceae bacterium]
MKKYTYHAKSTDNPGKWVLVDAKDKVLGRLATEIAARIRGKMNPMFTPGVDTGDTVIVINADQVRLTGRKWKQKTYYHHSGFTGGIKAITAEKLKEKRPEDLVRFAVRGMLPKNRLGRQLNRKLKVYVGEEHPHEAQQPEVLEI